MDRKSYSTYLLISFFYDSPFLKVSLSLPLQKLLIMLRIIILTIGLGLIFYFSPQIGLSQYLHEYKWIILAFFFAVSYLNHLLAQLGFANNRENFVQFYLGGIVTRLILSLIFVGVIAYMGTKDIYIFITNFFVLYLCYTGFEIYGLYRNLRHF